MAVFSGQGRTQLARMVPLAGLAGRTAGEAVVAALRRRLTGEDSAAEFHERTSERYAAMLGHSKGVLMKAGQVLSFVALGKLVPPERQRVYQAAMARLQADAPPMAPELAAAVVEAELGAPPEEIFAEFDPHAFAAASIGQVHAARLVDGRRVAVKVQYPGVDQAIRADLGNTELLATFLQLVVAIVPGSNRLDVRAVAQEVAARIGDEIDYRIEATHQAEFADAYRDHPFIRVPEVVPQLSTRRVLTMDLVDGMRWSEAIQADQRQRDRWGEVIYRFALGSLRSVGLFHADPHPGNYLFHEDGGVTFLDFGCVNHFSAQQIAMMRRLVAAAVANDAAALWDAFVEIGFLTASDAPAPAELLEWYRDKLRPLVDEQPFTYTPEFASSVVQGYFARRGAAGSVIRRVELPREYVFLTRIDLGLTALLAELEATGPWAAIRSEWDENGPPATEIGELDAEHWARRGLRGVRP
ncbi:MAG TPA: AarF/ABC1/UbiB kinase family protein [Pseudonocardiaceae bacterium]|nr:AarF/ABC1/UbiB kinase family protein [Pseudonocardiaceae bacterium]